MVLGRWGWKLRWLVVGVVVMVKAGICLRAVLLWVVLLAGFQANREVLLVAVVIGAVRRQRAQMQDDFIDEFDPPVAYGYGEPDHFVQVGRCPTRRPHPLHAARCCGHARMRHCLPPSPCRAQVAESSSFASRSSRALPWDGAAARETAQQPGPGAYQPHKHGAPGRPRPSAAFASASARFTPEGSGGIEYVSNAGTSMSDTRPGSAQSSAVFSSSTPRFEKESTGASLGQARRASGR